MSSIISELESNSSKQLKVNINESVANSIKLLAQASGFSQSQIVEESLTNYLNNSFAWRMRRIFLQKVEYTVTDSDLTDIKSGTEAYVVCKLDKDSTITESISADIINIDSNKMVTIQLKNFISPIPDQHKLNIDDDALVIPKIVDWQPNNFNLPFQSTAPYLHNYRYTIHAKYLWSIHVPYAGQVLNSVSSYF